MKRGLIYMVLMLLMGARIAAHAQELTVSDIQNSGCMRSTRARANENEKRQTIIMTKEGDILSVQLLGFVANCAIGGFDVAPSLSDSAPRSVSISVEPIEGEVMSTCVCPYNVSFTLHGLETNSFHFSCWWYDGQVSLTDGEPLTLESITEYVTIEGYTYIVEKVSHTATYVCVDTGETGIEVMKDFIIPSKLDYEGHTYIVDNIDDWAFLNARFLNSVVIPSSITSIGEAAFLNCSNLTDVYCCADNVPKTKSSVFKNVPVASATLHVPVGSIDAYRTTSPWSDFGTIVALKADDPTGITKVDKGTGEAIFDLQGRKIDKKTQPGIYIGNGKKILIK